MAAALIRLGIFLLLLYVGWRVYKSMRRLPAAPARPGQPAERSAPHLKVVEMKREPRDVLGLPEGASLEQAREARDRLLAENDPQRVAHMSPEVRAAARRVCEEVEEAYADLTREVH